MADKVTSSAQLLSKVLGLERRAQRPIDAWHASPHDFDKFSLDKIGTGQGAASYGHGIYAAESPAVSGPLGAYDLEFTNHKLRKSNSDIGDVRDDPVMYDIFQRMRRAGARDEDIVKELSAPADVDPTHFFETRAKINLARLRDNAAKLYELKLHAAPEDFLDWDKDMMLQSPQVSAALRRTGLRSKMDESRAYLDDLYEVLIDPSHPGYGREFKDPSMSGAAAYQSKALVPGEYRDGAAASKTLRDAGIPGLKYLDQGSRGTNSGTSNYVIFDPEIIEIAKKYGLLPGAVGAGAMMGDEDE